MALIDILIPVYNAGGTIEASVQSICVQTIRDLRLVVVDDGSTDATSDILRRLAASDDRIHVVTTANGGIVDALNVALAASAAPFVARHDADDLAFPDRLEKQLAYLQAHADCIAVGCNAYHIDFDGRRTGHVTDFKPTVRGDPERCPSLEPYLLHPFLLARRAALIDVFHSEDTDLYWRLSDLGRLSNLPDVLGEYRIHPDSVSSKSVLNGRISAINSQLAAVSEKRRRRAEPDIRFAKSQLQCYHDARELDQVIAAGSIGLSDVESRYLAMATAAKLLELSSYRPYRMTSLDLATIRRTIERHYDVMSSENRLYVIFRMILGRKRLARDWTEAARLIPWRVMPRACFEAAPHLPAFLGRLGKRLLRRMSMAS